MNYLAHARDVLDRPYEVAGTALPDWLQACDRGARLRRREVTGAAGEIAAGVRRHLDEDRWFHGSAPFLEVSGTLTRLIRAENDDPRLRAAFFGHLLTEMLLDATLAAAEPGRLDAYYAALAEVAAGEVERAARGWTSRPPRRLGEFIDLFRRGRWLYGYLDDPGLAARVEGVARRVGVAAPKGLAAVLPAARRLVAARAQDLLEEPPWSPRACSWSATARRTGTATDACRASRTSP